MSLSVVDAVAPPTPARPHLPDPADRRAEHPAGSRPPVQLDLEVPLTVLRWDDPRANANWHDLRGDYVERFWLGVLGPGTTLLLRRFARGFVERPDGFRVDPADTAGALGMGRGTGRNSMIARTLDRACQFGTATRIDEHTLAVRSLLPPLSSRQLSRLPPALQRAHDVWLERHSSDRTAPSQRARTNQVG